MTNYVLKMVLCSGLLLIAYQLFLEKEKMHHFKRVYLLISILLSFTVPILPFRTNTEIIPFGESEYMVKLLDVDNLEKIQPAAPEPELNGWNPDYLIIGYSLIAGFLFAKFITNLFLLRKQINLNARMRFGPALVVLSDSKLVPHSFLHYIFLNKEKYLQKGIEEEILHHEMTHVRQKHSWDIIFIELLMCFAWFNPFLYGYKKAIRLNHEYLADDSVLKQFPDAKSYQYLLLNTVSNTSHSILTSSFNYLSIKKRLIMMTKTRSQLIISIKQFLVLPVLLIAILVFSTKIVAQNPVKSNPQNTEHQKLTGQKPDTTKPSYWAKQTIAYTNEGVSEALLKEYQEILDKYKYKGTNNALEINPEKITEADRRRLESIYKQMSLTQQKDQEVGFFKTILPFPKVVPTKQQLENFKNPNAYGVWVNGKKVQNSTLNNYTNSDFSQVFISKLYGAAKKGRAYTHQVDLMTNEYYNNYYNERIKDADKSNMVVIVSGNKKYIKIN